MRCPRLGSSLPEGIPRCCAARLALFFFFFSPLASIFFLLLLSSFSCFYLLSLASIFSLLFLSSCSCFYLSPPGSTIQAMFACVPVIPLSSLCWVCFLCVCVFDNMLLSSPSTERMEFTRRCQLTNETKSTTVEPSLATRAIPVPLALLQPLWHPSDKLLQVRMFLARPCCRIRCQKL